MKPTPNTASLILILMLTLSLSLAGCGALGEKATPTPEVQIDETSNSLINATGVVVPEQWAALSMPGQGLVAEVLVADGDSVTAGQPLVRLDGQESAISKVGAAQYELADAQYAIDQLQKNAAAETAQALQELQAAQREVMVAERSQVPYDLQKYKDDLERARDTVVDTKDSLDTAKEDFAPYEDWDESNSTRKSFQDRLDEAQRKYDEAVRVENELVLSKDQAQAALQSAQADRDLAQAEYDQRKDGPAAGTLALAQSRRARAQTQLSAAQAELDDLELRAPFDGVVCSLKARVGEWLAPGQTILELGDLARLQVETTDLNEIDAARIQPGYQAAVTFDALPDVSVRGTVQRIAQKSSAGSGVNYTVLVQLDEVPADLRWGMTAFIDIEVEK